MKLGKILSKIAVGILGILTAMLVFTAGCRVRDGKTETQNNLSAEHGQEKRAVLYLDGIAVPEEEYALLAAENANQVYMSYTTDQVNSEDFWDTKIDGIYPYETLAGLVLEELKRCYAIRSLAVELGLTKEYDYNDLKAGMQMENETKQDSSEGEAAYGLSSYESSSYYKYWYSNLTTRVVNALIQNRVSVTQEDCRNYYEDHMEEFSCQIQVKVLYVEIPRDIGNRSEQAQFCAERMQGAAVSADDLSAALPEASVQELTLSSFDTQEGLSGIYRQRWEYASRLQEGETYGPYEQDGTLCLIKCCERRENSVLDFSDVSARIEQYLQEQKAQSLIEDRVDRMEVSEGDIPVRTAILNAVAEN